MWFQTSNGAGDVELYTVQVDAHIAAMSFDSPLPILAAGFLVIGTIWIGSHYLSHDAKLSRRRRRNNARIEPKVNRPMVRLSVRTGKRK